MTNRLLLVLLLSIACISSCVAADVAKPSSFSIPLAQRATLAVMPLDSGAIKRADWWGPKWDIGSGMADILTSEMMQKNCFRLVERSALNKAIEEQQLTNSALADPKYAIQVGKVAGSEYLIMGKITEFSWEKENASGIGAILGGITGVSKNSTKARVALDLRIVDTSSGEIIYAGTGSGEETKGSMVIANSQVGAAAVGSSDFMESILGKASRKAVGDWTSKLVKSIAAKQTALASKRSHLDGIVLDVEGNVCITNTGASKCYVVGDKIQICRKGKVIKDPDTGEVLRVTNRIVAKGIVVKVDDKTADVSFEMAEANESVRSGDLVKYAE